MGFKNERTFLAADDVKATFLQLLRCYEKDFDQECFYGVNMDQSNPHSLVSLLGLDDYGALKVLSLLKIVYHRGDNLRIRRKLKYWKEGNGERGEFFGYENIINWRNSRFCRHKRSEAFVWIGPDQSMGGG